MLIWQKKALLARHSHFFTSLSCKFSCVHRRRLENGFMKKEWVTYSFTSSSGRPCGMLDMLIPRHESSTSSDVPLQVHPIAFHGSQISFSVFPKSPYCLSACSYSRLASSSIFPDGTMSESCSKMVSDNLDVCSFERVSLYLVKFRRIKTIKSRRLRGAKAMWGEGGEWGLVA